jgi:hypothetical protein
MNQRILSFFLIALYLGIIQAFEEFPIVLTRPIQKNSKTIPKVIYTFWASGQINTFVMDCIGTWSKHAPDYRVNIITLETVHQYTNKVIPKSIYSSNITVQAKSDWIRLAVILEHGGIWLDASVILTGTLAWIHKYQQKYSVENIFFYLESSTMNLSRPHIESNVFASVPKSPFIKAWFSEFHSILSDYNMSDLYLADLMRKYGLTKYLEILQGNGNPSYLKIYVASRKVMIIDRLNPSAFFLPASRTIYKLTEETEWDYLKFLPFFFGRLKHDYQVAGINKLYSDYRNAATRTLETQKFQNVSFDSFYAKYVAGMRIYFAKKFSVK